MLAGITSRAGQTLGLPKSVHAFGVNALLLPLGIATSVLIARTVGPAGKGTLDLIIASAALLTMLLSLSLPPGITYVVAQGKVNLNILASHVALLGLLQASLALGVLSLLRAAGYSDFMLPNWGWWIVAGVALFVLVDMSNRYWGSILSGRQQIAVVNNAELIGRLTQFFVLFILAGALYLSGRRLSVWVLFVVSLGISILINLLLLFSLAFKFQLSSDTSGLKAALAFALPCYAANTAQFLNYRLDVFIVGFLAGASSVGRYTLAVSLGQLLWLMSTSVASVLLPKIAASSDTAESIKQTARINRLSLWATVLGGAALAVLGSVAIPLLYGEAFRPTVAALLWILPGIVVFSNANVLAAYIAGIGKPRLNLYASGLGLLVTITLDLILIPKLGIVGASMASTASYSLSAILLVAFFVKQTGASLREILLPTHEDLKFLFSLARPLLRRAGLQWA